MHPALARVQDGLVPGGDTEYFAFHRRRFEQHLARLQKLNTPGARVLDIGSHYLHLSSALSRAGYDVIALDVEEFQGLDFVRRRATEFGVRCEVVRDLGRGDFLPAERPDSFDCLVFCEILEHITFNPVRFWRRVYDLLRPGGCVYLTTPNSLRHSNILRTVRRAVGLRGVGIPVEEIFQHVTYGHHWKEYSAPELRDYFDRLSPDFGLEITMEDFDLSVARRSALARAVRAAGIMPRMFRPHLEVVIRLPRKTRWRAVAKRYEE